MSENAVCESRKPHLKIAKELSSKDVKLISLHMHQVLKDSKLSSMLSNHVGIDRKVRNPHRKAVKRTVAPLRYQRTKMWTGNVKRKIAAI